ncbi:MAG: polysaccharide biosynthesis/export family protein [Bacteroidales bacterium]|jgi:polysaccharide export outer membrane protein|nr:polysaccharide biosynthesis/export family protein [Bacteroidales bacterium]
MKKTTSLLGKTGFMIIFLVFAVSCVPTSKLSYFNDIDTVEEPLVNPKIQKTIMPFDRLYIRILSIDPQIRQIFDIPEEARYSASSTSIIGYLVDEAGDINFPFTGKINVVGLTTSDAGAKIQSALNEYVPNTSILVNFIDNRISVMGEVQQQGVYSFSQDKLNIYEALALGGGITRYGNRKNVVLIRQEGEKIMHYRLNLADSRIATREVYYVLPNDVVVVEPLKSISSSYQNITYQTILSSVTTLIAGLLFLGYGVR